MATIAKIIKGHKKEDVLGELFNLNDRCMIVKTGSGYLLRAGEEVRINGNTVTGDTILSETAVIVTRGDIYIFYDTAKVQEKEEARISRVRRASGIEKQYNLSEIQTQCKEKFALYMNSKKIKNSTDFLTAFCDFARADLKIDRIVGYRPEPQKWVPVVSRAPAGFRPPMKLALRVYKTGEPLIFDVSEKIEDLSKSIIDNKVVSAFIFPIYHSEYHKILFVIYADTNVEHLSERVFAVVSYLCQYISKPLSTFFRVKEKDAVPKLKELDLPRFKEGEK